MSDSNHHHHHHHLQIHVNSQHTFFLSQRIISTYSLKLRAIINQSRQTPAIEIDSFPGGPHAFELISSFCHNNGVVSITVANVCLLHCCAVFLEMTEQAAPINLLHQTQIFLEGIYYWSHHDVIACLNDCDAFFDHASSCGLIEKLLPALLAKIAQNSDVNSLSSSSFSSPETCTQGVCGNASMKKARFWWFRELTVLSPRMIERFLKALGCYGSENDNLVVTRFVLHYLKTALYSNGSGSRSRSGSRRLWSEYGGVADTAVHGVVLVGKNVFSCRGLFSVLRIVSVFGLSKRRRMALERLIGSMLEQATLDDLLVSGGGNGGGVYDVSFVIRLIKLFVHYNDDDDEKVPLQKMKRVGELIDMYLGEIGPDPNLKISKFLGVAESLPDYARDSFDHVYRALDILLQSHPTLSLEERSRLCRCLNFKKLSLEACKDLAKNPRIPPRISVQALSSQHSTVQTVDSVSDDSSNLSRNYKDIIDNNDYQLVLYEDNDNAKSLSDTEILPDGDEMKVNLEMMQWKVVELEKVCREMKGQMSRMVKLGPQYNRPLPRLC